MGSILAIALLIRTMADLCFKGSVHRLNFSSIDTAGKTYLSLLKKPLFWFSIFLVGINFWLWVMVLSQFDLSYAYPSFSFSYVLIMLGGKVFFHEHLDRYKLSGIACIALSSIILVLG